MIKIYRFSQKISLMLCISFLLISTIFGQDSTVTDYDGNVYQTVTIGNQVWLKENLKSLHYTDGTPIPDVASYNDSDSMAQIYGRLYSWYDTVRDSVGGENVQGVCPCNWHVPTNAEWRELEDYLGGWSIAGGAMKEASYDYWTLPNTGATNSSGFSALPAGEWDPNSNPKYRLLKEYAVFWTATPILPTKASERYLKYSSSASTTFNWYRELKYSIRCVKNQSSTNIDNKYNNFGVIKSFQLINNYPNPFNPSTTISYNLNKDLFVNLAVYNLDGDKIQTLVNQQQIRGKYNISFNAHNLSSGIYFYQIKADNMNEIGRMLLLK